MNTKAFLILLLFVMTSTSLSLFFGGKYLNDKIYDLSKMIFSDILSKEADVLVAVTRNDFLIGNTKLARSVLEKAINKSGISEIEIVSDDKSYQESIGDIDAGDILFVIEKDVYFNSTDLINKWGTFKFKVTNHQFQTFSSQVINLQLFTVIPLFLVFFTIFVLAFYLVGYSSLFLHRFILTENNQHQSPTKIEKVLWNDLIINILRAKDKLLTLINEQNNFEKERTFSNLSRQVAHDIRSPLSALNMAMHGLSQIPEERRLLIRNAVARINDIANSLLKKGKLPHNQQPAASHEAESVSLGLNETEIGSNSLLLLPAVIDSIVSEKRIQFRDKINLFIEVDLRDSFGTFVTADAVELGRVISNLVNNSVESFVDGSGEITVAVRGYRDQAMIVIKDNGRGIPVQVLARLGEQGISHGKNGSTSGSGLGIYHAKMTIEGWGGSFEIQSQEKLGTSIEIKLPRSLNPSWFASAIQIPNGAMVVVVDDDLSIHQIWRDRLQSLRDSSSEVRLQNFTSASDFLNFEINDSMIFLIDYEFLNQKENGIDLIKAHNIFSRATLVTSRHEEFHIRETCERLKFKLLPKQLAEFIPIEIIPTKKYFDYILIDDDSLVHLSWNMGAKESKKNVRTFFSIDEFLTEAPQIHPSSPIYVDVDLSSIVRGEQIAEKIHAIGFAKIYLSTGYQLADIVVPNFIIRVVGKDFPG